MKKGFLIQLLLVILLCAVYALAFADPFDEPVYLTYQIGLPGTTEADGYFDSKYSVEFNTADSLARTPVVWSVLPADGGPKMSVSGTFTVESDGSFHCWLSCDPDEKYTPDTSYHYVVRADLPDAEYEGSYFEKDVYISFVDDLPDEKPYILVTPIDASTDPATFGEPVKVEDGSIDVIAGKPYAISVHAGTNDRFSRYENNNILVNGWQWIDPYDVQNPEWRNVHLDSNQDLYLATTPGIHRQELYLQYYPHSNLGLKVPLTLNVYDENGHLPQPVPEMSGGFVWRGGSSGEVLDVTIYLGLPLDAANGIWNHSEIVAIYLSNRNLLEKSFGGSPAWSMETVTTSGTGTLDLGELVPNLNGVRASLKTMPTEPMEAEITVTCTWGPVQGSKKIRVHVKEPSFAMPEGLSNLPDVIRASVGDTIILEPQVEPAGWSLPGYEGDYYTRHGLGSFASRDWNNADPPAYRINKAGLYSEIIEIQFGAVSVSKEVTFEITENRDDPEDGFIKLSVSPEEPALHQDVTISWDIQVYTDYEEAYVDTYIYANGMMKRPRAALVLNQRNKTGTWSITLDEGEFLWVSVGLYAGEKYIGAETGWIPLSGEGNVPETINVDVSYATGEKGQILADYQITGGAGRYPFIQATWVRLNEDGTAVQLHTRYLHNASGQMIYSPVISGRYALTFDIVDWNGWELTQDEESITQFITADSIPQQPLGIEFLENFPEFAEPNSPLDFAWDVTGGGAGDERRTDVLIETDDHIELEHLTAWYFTNFWSVDLSSISAQSKSVIISLTPMEGETAGKTVTRVVPIHRNRKLILPRGLVSIEAEAFLNVNADEIDIPDGVAFIGSRAFPENVTLIVGSGTYAEEWAAQNGYTPVIRNP